LDDQFLIGDLGFLPFDFCDLPFDLFFNWAKTGQKAKRKR
jgi:hypothetical protein